MSSSVLFKLFREIKDFFLSFIAISLDYNFKNPRIFLFLVKFSDKFVE